MILEKDDYFVVTRGFKYGRSSFSFQSIFGVANEGEGWKSPNSEPDEQYDRSEVGVVFRAVEVCGDVCVAEVIINTKGYGDSYKVGARKSMHLNEIKIEIVTKEYVLALKETSKSESNLREIEE